LGWDKQTWSMQLHHRFSWNKQTWSMPLHHRFEFEYRTPGYTDFWFTDFSWTPLTIPSNNYLTCRIPLHHRSEFGLRQADLKHAVALLRFETIRPEAFSLGLRT
jgi:hypothetical protein